jgi:hypothetical protein
LLRAVGEPLDLYTSRALIDELANTLARKKFARRIALQDTNIDALIADYLGLAELVVPASGPRISRDPDDDHVITCPAPSPPRPRSSSPATAICSSWATMATSASSTPPARPRRSMRSGRRK